MYRFVACGLFLLCVSMISACSIVPPSTPVTQPGSTQTEERTQPFHAVLKTIDEVFTLTLDITPNRTGTNVFLMHVRDNRTGQQATDIQVRLYTTMQDMDMGTDTVVLHADGNGGFIASSDNLSMAGHWAIGIVIQTSDQIIHKVGVSLITSA